MKNDTNLVICRRLKLASLTVIAGLLPGCTLFPIGGYGPDGQTRADFENRVETAFRLQNQMTSEVMVMQETDGYTKRQEAIVEAEQRMQKSCRHLNEYASREMDGLNTGFLLLRRVENSVVECETSARQVQALLKLP